MLEYMQFSPSDNVPLPTASLVAVMGFLGMFLMYTYIAYLSLEVSYALIYQLPERLMKWAGGPQDALDVKDRVASIKLGATQLSKSLSDSAKAQQGATTGSPMSAGKMSNTDKKYINKPK